MLPADWLFSHVMLIPLPNRMVLSIGLNSHTKRRCITLNYLPSAVSNLQENFGPILQRFRQLWASICSQQVFRPTVIATSSPTAQIGNESV